jgi:hypothetical protein
MIDASDWKWQGHAAHFICAADCQFHMATLIGGVVVSTVGDYKPQHRGGKQDKIGCDRTYETMVFPAEPDPDCGCAQPTDLGELDMEGYNSHPDAIAGHMAMCVKWAELDGIAPSGES